MMLRSVGRQLQFARDDNGNVIGFIGPDGVTRRYVEDIYVLPSYKVRITADQPICGKSCSIVSVRCIVGVAAGISLRDHPTAASGEVLFSNAAMNADDEIVFPSPVPAINGVFGDVTGVGTFDVEIRNAL
jgi:hypothetical protein